MFENWTREDFFKFYADWYKWDGEFDGMATYLGRVAITDDQELEKIWDKFVQSRQELKSKFKEWEQNDK